MDDLQTFLRDELHASIVDPAGEYYDDYYAVFFLDPDGLKLEGMKYGERTGEARPRRARSRDDSWRARTGGIAQRSHVRHRQPRGAVLQPAKPDNVELRRHAARSE